MYQLLIYYKEWLNKHDIRTTPTPYADVDQLITPGIETETCSCETCTSVPLVFCDLHEKHHNRSYTTSYICLHAMWMLQLRAGADTSLAQSLLIAFGRYSSDGNVYIKAHVYIKPHASIKATQSTNTTASTIFLSLALKSNCNIKIDLLHTKGKISGL